MSLLSSVEMLKKAPLPEVRETIATKIAQYYNNGVFDQEEIAVAADILRLLTKDAEIRVRIALAENLKNNKSIPHDVAMALAQDEAVVATPILEFSKALTEGDLLQIIRSTQQVAKLTAIARRENIQDSITSALAHTHNEEVVVYLFANKTASISDESITSVINEFKNNGNVISTLIDRGGLSVGIAEKLLNFVSNEMRDRLVKEYNFTSGVAKDVADASREKATLGLLSDKPIDKEMWQDKQKAAILPEDEVKKSKADQLVSHLYKEGRLTQSIILRSLCEGNMSFFESSMSILAGVPVINVRTLISDKNPAALESLCKRAKMPTSVIASMKVIIKFIVEESEAGTFKKEGFKQRLLEYISANGYDETVSLMPYITALIGSNVHVSDVIDAGA